MYRPQVVDKDLPLLGNWNWSKWKTQQTMTMFFVSTFILSSVCKKCMHKNAVAICLQWRAYPQGLLPKEGHWGRRFVRFDDTDQVGGYSETSRLFLLNQCQWNYYMMVLFCWFVFQYQFVLKQASPHIFFTQWQFLLKKGISFTHYKYYRRIKFIQIKTIKKQQELPFTVKLCINV